MALKIENASIGYDEDGVRKLSNDIHSNVIIATKDIMSSEVTAIHDIVGEHWVGGSAEIFKTNMEHDMTVVSQALDNEYTDLVSKLQEVATVMGEKEEEVITKRG